MSLVKKAIAEFIGTLVLVVFGCGVAMFSGADLVATSLAFGLSIVAMAYSIGNISGCHVNPAVSFGMVLSHKMTWLEFGVYVLAQFLGAICGALLLELFFHYVGHDATGALGANQIQQVLLASGKDVTFGGEAMGFLIETFLTFVFVLVILGVTSKPEFNGVAGVIIGLTLTLIHLLGIGFTGTSVNPARSFGPALICLINGVNEPIKEIWIFLLAPMAGAALAALCYNFLASVKAKQEEAKEVK
jgi:aquaporin Z